MSNVGRPTTGMKFCPYCGSTDRDSNGQCHCRNVLYRVRQRYNKKVALGVTPERAARAAGKSVRA